MRPRGEEVVAESESGLEHAEVVAIVPARRQAVAGDEDVRRLREGAGASMVDIAVHAGERRAFVD